MCRGVGGGRRSKGKIREDKIKFIAKINVSVQIEFTITKLMIILTVQV